MGVEVARQAKSVAGCSDSGGQVMDRTQMTEMAAGGIRQGAGKESA